MSSPQSTNPKPTAASIPTTLPSAPPSNPEKRNPVSQNEKDAARFERIQQFIQAHREIFARGGAIVPTWRTYSGKRLGPYYQLAYRDRGRQHWLYLGRSEQLTRQIRELLDSLHRPRDRHRLYRRLQTQARSSLRRVKAHLKEVCAKWSITLKGFEFRGVRKALASRGLSPPRCPHPPSAPPPPNHFTEIGG